MIRAEGLKGVGFQPCCVKAVKPWAAYSCELVSLSVEGRKVNGTLEICVEIG